MYMQSVCLSIFSGGGSQAHLQDDAMDILYCMMMMMMRGEIKNPSRSLPVMNLISFLNYAHIQIHYENGKVQVFLDVY